MSNLIYNVGTSTNTDYYEFIKKLQDCQGCTFSRNTTGYDIVKNTPKKTDDKKETEETNKKVEITLCNYIPKKIYFNGPVTVVVWEDGEKTRVRRHDTDPDNRYSAFCAALAKKIFGNNTVVNKIVNTGIYCSSNKVTKEKEGTDICEPKEMISENNEEYNEQEETDICEPKEMISENNEEYNEQEGNK